MQRKRKNKIEKLGLGMRVIALRAKMKSEREIAKIISDESNENVSHITVNRFFKRQTHKIRGIIEGNEALEKQEATLQLNIFSQLSRINADTLDILKDAKAKGEKTIVLQAIDRIERQLRLQALITGLTPQEGPKSLALTEVVVHNAQRND